MNKKELEELIKKGESEIVEFKTSLSEWRSALESLAAFSWDKGGIVIFGISPTRKIIGVEMGKGTIESLANSIKQNTDPKLYPSIKVFEIENKDIILVETEKISNEPVLAFGKSYKRVGKSTHQISREEYKRVIKNLSEQEFDGQVCEKATLKDINDEAVNKFREKYEEINKTAIRSSNKELLKSFGCLIDSKVTNAGILLFGKDPGKFFPRYYVSIARYPGKDIGRAYLEIKDIEGNLFEIIDNSEKYIKQHIETLYMLKEGQIAREPVSQYPDFVIRELITNAVAHRDYRIKGSRILIKMFKDRIEFDSPGGFPGNVNESNILKEQFSRNPIIVKVLNKVKYIEEMGEGWNRIVDIIKSYALKFERLPKIEGNSRVIVTLFSPKLEEEIDKNAVDNWLTQVDARLTQELSEQEKEIILFILKRGKITSENCQKLLKVSREMVNRYFRRLIERKLIKRKGAGKYVYYVLKVMQSNAKTKGGKIS